MLTEHQIKALDFEHHLSVTANAGAGKTMVLVRRFVEILVATDIPVRQLVAITFTEKAASELRKKVAEYVEQKIRAAAGSGERIRLDRIRDQLSSANIGTIHSFCARILREFPVEADIDAAFTVLEGVDQQALEQAAMRDTFESILKKPDTPADRDEVLDVTRMLGQRTVQSYLTAFLQKREHIDRLLQADGWLSDQKSDADVLAFWKRSADEFVADALDDSRWLESAKRILHVATGKTVPKAGVLLDRWSSSLPVAEKISLYREFLEIVLTQRETLRKEFIGAKTDMSSITADEKVLADHRKSIAPFIVEGVDRDGANTILLRVLRTLMKLHMRIVERYASKKYENGQLDFDDLQLKTRELLQKEHIRGRIAEKYSFLMIDEYQDTNRLQYEILRLLILNFDHGNLFIVGDPKQSIYGFRNAEVEVFETTRRDILQANARWHDGAITLAESFRLLPAIVDFVNRVFFRTMGTASSGFDVRYDELIKGRNNSAEGRVELLLVPTLSMEDSGADPIAVECLSIGRRIAELVRSEYVVYGMPDESPHPFRFKDAAILLRSRSHVREMEKALVDFNVPYQLSGGIGFYQTQEVLDFLNYFSFLLNADDDVALVGLLRSPFFAVSDAELFELTLLNGTESFWEKLVRHSNRSQAGRESKRAATTLLRDLQLANRLPIPFLVQRIITQTGWQGTIAGLTLGAQNSANIQKLLRIAREFEGKGFLSLYDFVERLRALTVREEREGQAGIESGGDCVQVMTIHAAKGLEFPVVFLPFASQQIRYDDAPHIDQSFGIGFKVREEKDYDREAVPEFFHFLRRRSKARTEAEEKRIFYVGCTRARDMLVVSGVYEPESRNPCYLRWLMSGLELDDKSIGAGTHVLPPTGMKILDPTTRTSRVVTVEHSLALNISYADGGVVPLDVRAPVGTEGHPVLIDLTDPLEAKARGEFFSATQIRTYQECPTKYYLKYILGLPEQAEAFLPFHEEDDQHDNNRIGGELLGLVTHRILEEIGSASVQQSEIRQRVEQLVLIETSITEMDRPTLVETIIRNIDKFIDSGFGKRVLSASRSKNEFSLSVKFDSDFITGTIDRLYAHDEAGWSILDYKTDDIAFGSMEDRAKMYKPQLATYAFLVSRFFHQSSVETAIVFLRHPDTPVRFLFSEQDLTEFEIGVRRMIEDIRECRFGLVEESGCHACTYQHSGLCPILTK